MGFRLESADQRLLVFSVCVAAVGTFVCMFDGCPACVIQEVPSCDKVEWSKFSLEYKQPDRVMAGGSTAPTFRGL